MEVEDVFEEWDGSDMIDMEEIESVSYGERIDVNKSKKILIFYFLRLFSETSNVNDKSKSVNIHRNDSIRKALMCNVSM